MLTIQFLNAEQQDSVTKLFALKLKTTSYYVTGVLIVHALKKRVLVHLLITIEHSEAELAMNQSSSSYLLES